MERKEKSQGESEQPYAEDRLLEREKLGRRVREIRIRQGLSQEQLSLETGLSRSHVQLIERGRVNVSLDTLERLLDALEISARDFFCKTDLR